jgi:peptidoglycan/xylan/chitin deacetylase (PgdA/CDA1 family)
VTHPVLSQCPLGQQRQEIQQCKARIETELGMPISAFSYPIGQPWAFTSDTKRMVREAGYRWGFSFFPGFATSSSDPFDLRRVAMETQTRLPELRAMTQMPRLFAR